MNCEIFKILYLRANGEVPCNCGSGEKVNLGWAEAGAEWSISRLVSGRAYAHMEAAFKRGERPWGDVCTQCVFLKPNEPFENGFAKKHLVKVHVEPSLACALRCPGCSRVHQAKERKGPVFLPVDVYRRVLTSLRDEGFRVDQLYFCGQGEPLSHPKIEDLIQVSREVLPGTEIMINTNANYRYHDVFKRRQLPDKFIVSIDGVQQSSYEQYRINGDVASTFDFVRDAKSGPGPHPVVEWKYILFRYNDSDEEIVAAQRRAEELKVDSLQFVLTHTQEKSLRFTPDTLDQMPIVSPLAYPETTPHLYFKRQAVAPLTETNSNLVADFNGRERVHCVVDECRYRDGFLYVRGWAVGKDGRSPARLSFRADGQPLGDALLGVRRDDVADALPELNNRSTGFRLVGRFSGARDESFTLTVAYATPDGATYSFPIRYSSRPPAEQLANPDSR